MDEVFRELGVRLLGIKHVVGYTVSGGRLVVYVNSNSEGVRRAVIDLVRRYREDLVVEFIFVRGGFQIY